MPTPPHDALFKSAFGQPELARSELELLLPAALREHLDLATLVVHPGSFVDDELRHAHTDLLYGVRTRGGATALVYVLMEHQSTFDARMPLRLLRYMVRVWEGWERDHAGSKLPIVIPVVLCHDPRGWRAAPAFASMLDAGPELLAAAGPFQPLFRFVLDDLGSLSLESLASRELHGLALLVELAFWATSTRRLSDAAPRMGAITSKLDRDAPTRSLLTQLYVYLLRTAAPEVEGAEVRGMLEQIAGPQGREDVVNAAEQLIAEGLERGLERGRAQGQVEGRRSSLFDMIAARGLRLSELGRTRIASCSDPETLTRWIVRAATASTEADVFAADATG
jgi:predicted transposase/invertase (TIGR01784 family)